MGLLCPHFGVCIYLGWKQVLLEAHTVVHRILLPCSLPLGLLPKGQAAQVPSAPSSPWAPGLSCLYASQAGPASPGRGNGGHGKGRRSVEYQIRSPFSPAPAPLFSHSQLPLTFIPLSASRPTLSSAPVTPYLCSEPLKCGCSQLGWAVSVTTPVSNRMKKSQCQMF